LKTKTFISQKSLDTPVFRLIRFAQKVLTDFKAPLELFSLEEEAALLPGSLFVFAFHSAFSDDPERTQKNFAVMRGAKAGTVAHFLRIIFWVSFVC
jgi:hypothetical protein